MRHGLTRIKRINTDYNSKLKINFVMFVWFAVNLLFFSACVSTPKVDYAGLGSPNDLVPLSQRVITGNLPNGLRYYILENSLPANRAHLGLVVYAGSVLETDDQRGYAHFIEHLAFSDTARFPDLEIQTYLRSLGMRFGPDFNANTSHERTLYYFDIPVETVNDVKRIPEKGLAILDDWTHGITFKPDFVESERNVILEEMRSRSGAQERIRKIIFPLIFSGSAYEDREVIGLGSTIKDATQQSLKDFYDRWYYSHNMAIIFIGDFDGKALEAELINHFNMPLVRHRAPRPIYDLPPPKNGKIHIEIITDPEITTADYSIYFKQKHSEKKGTLAYYRETVIDYLISAMLNQRFDEASRDPDTSFSESWGGPWYWAQNSKFYLMGTTPKTGKAEQALSELVTEMESMRRDGFTENELHRAKLNLVSYMERQLSEKDRKESRTFLRGLVSNFLYGEDFADIEWELDAVNALLPGIGVKEIAQQAKNYFAANDIIVILTAPEAEKDNLPSQEKIKQIITGARRLLLTKRQDEKISSELVDSLIEPGKIISEVQDKETDAIIMQLSNGAKVILQQTQNRNNEIVMYAMAKGGTLNATDEEAISSVLISEMFQVSGLGPYTRTQLINKLAGKQVSMSFWAGGYYRGLQGSSTTGDLQTLFEMIHIFFAQPMLEERAITAMLDQYKTELMHKLEDPQTVFFNEVTKTVTNNHPRFKPMELEDIGKVSLEMASYFSAKCLNIADYTFVFTGNIDLDAIRNYIEKYLSSVEELNMLQMNEFADHGITRPKDIQKTIFKGQDDRSMVYLSWYAPGESEFNEEKNQISAVLNEYMDILLNDEIRERLGGVYGISAGASVSVIPKGEYSLSVYFVCNPERVEELSSAVIASLENLANKPLNTETFNQAKEALLMQHERSMQRNIHIAQSYANSAVLYDTPLSRLSQRPDVIRAITPEQVQQLCKAMLSQKPVRVVLYPEGRE